MQLVCASYMTFAVPLRAPSYAFRDSCAVIAHPPTTVVQWGAGNPVSLMACSEPNMCTSENGNMEATRPTRSGGVARSPASVSPPRAPRVMLGRIPWWARCRIGLLWPLMVPRPWKWEAEARKNVIEDRPIG